MRLCDLTGENQIPNHRKGRRLAQSDRERGHLKGCHEVKRYDTTRSAVSRAAGIDSPVEKHLPAMHKVQSSIPGTSDVPVDFSLFHPFGSS